MLPIPLPKTPSPPTSLTLPQTASAPQDIYRVLRAWDRMVENQPFEDKETQRFATSYIEGLEAKPWHEVDKCVVN